MQRIPSATAGFTLIEMLITVAIVAILAAIAIPAYGDYVRRGKITEAVSGLSDMRVKMEQYYQDNRSYAGSCVAGTVAPAPAPTKNFTFACTPAPTATAYTVEATGIGSMVNFRYSINESNVRTTLQLPPGDWTGQGNPCWVLKKDGSC